jgi:energy-coupling factor transport system permease protein
VRSRYRPDPWRAPEWAVALTGGAVAAIVIVASHADPAGLNPTLQPLRWPPLPLVPTLALLLGTLPAWLAPPLARPARPAPRPSAVSTTPVGAR